MIKYCPDMTSHEEVKAIMVVHGMLFMIKRLKSCTL